MPKSASKVALATIALTASSLVMAGPAEAAKKYANCDALKRDYRYGVAVSKKAAQRQVRDGNYKPAVKPKVYRVNKSGRDADKDGTACEVTR